MDDSVDINVSGNTISFNVARVRMAAAAVVALMGVLMIVGFFTFTWVDVGKISLMGYSPANDDEISDEERENSQISAYELWIGDNGEEKFTLNFEYFEDNEEPSGFGDVRFLDRFVILLPVGGLVLVWFAWMYVMAPAGSARKRSAALTMVGLALVLLMLPFAWQALSNPDIENDLETLVEQMLADEGLTKDEARAFLGGADLVDTSGINSTGEQQFLAGVALVAALAAAGVEFVLRPGTLSSE